MRAGSDRALATRWIGAHLASALLVFGVGFLYRKLVPREHFAWHPDLLLYVLPGLLLAGAQVWALRGRAFPVPRWIWATAMGAGMGVVAGLETMSGIVHLSAPLRSGRPELQTTLGYALWVLTLTAKGLVLAACQGLVLWRHPRRSAVILWMALVAVGSTAGDLAGSLGSWANPPRWTIERPAGFAGLGFGLWSGLGSALVFSIMTLPGIRRLLEPAKARSGIS